MNRSFAHTAPDFRCLPPRRATDQFVTWWDAVTASWRQVLTRRQTTWLDDRTLRDIGIHRSELSSVYAELDGRAEATRIRVIQQRHPGV